MFEKLNKYRFRFSIRSLLLFTFVVAVLVNLFLYARVQAKAITMQEPGNGIIAYQVRKLGILRNDQGPMYFAFFSGGISSGVMLRVADGERDLEEDQLIFLMNGIQWGNKVLKTKSDLEVFLICREECTPINENRDAPLCLQNVIKRIDLNEIDKKQLRSFSSKDEFYLSDLWKNKIKPAVIHETSLLVKLQKREAHRRYKLRHPDETYPPDIWPPGEQY